MKIIKKENYIIIKKSKLIHIFKLMFYVIFTSLWYFVLLNKMNSYISKSYWFVIFYLAPIFCFVEILRSCKIIIGNDVFYFNLVTHEIFLDKKRLRYFDDVYSIQIRSIFNSDSSKYYRLSLILKDESKIRVGQSTNYDKALDVAEELADLLHVSITEK